MCRRARLPPYTNSFSTDRPLDLAHRPAISFPTRDAPARAPDGHVLAEAESTGSPCNPFRRLRRPSSFILQQADHLFGQPRPGPGFFVFEKDKDITPGFALFAHKLRPLFHVLTAVVFAAQTQ